MAKKGSAKKPKAASRAGSRVTLRTPSGAKIELFLPGNLLHRSTVPWNIWLVSTQLRQDVPKAERRRQARAVLAKVALAGGVGDKALGAFVRAATKEGVVQVETDWEGFSGPETDRLFPWEETIALACRDIGGQPAPPVVVRWLKRKALRAPVATGPAAIIVTRDAADAPFGTDSEYRVVRHALAGTGAGGSLPLRTINSLDQLRRWTKPQRHDPPRIVHWMLRSVDSGIVFNAHDLALTQGDSPPPGSRRTGPRALSSDQAVAEALAAGRPALVALSSCYTGRRLAPQVVAAGAELALGFHHEVDDSSLPAFFAEFHASWLAGADPIEALRRAIAFNHDQPGHEALGVVTLWSAHDLLAPPTPPPARSAVTPAPQARTAKGVAAAAIPLDFDCEPEPALNYSVLHCSPGGLFRRFVVTALDHTPSEPLDVVVRLDSGADSPAECRTTTPAPPKGNARIDLAALVSLPLGGQLLRQRRETLKGAVAVTVGAAGRTLFQRTWPIDLLPCDEWRDDVSGSQFLPSFVLPRDPAVRDILTHSQGFLRAITDCYMAAFIGYLPEPVPKRAIGVEAQLQAIWASLVDHYRLDYITTPPSYRESSQRIRTPNEVLLARRGTCIELSLLLASCWEHICIHPVLFLISGHAFCGYWKSERARNAFFASLADHHAEDAPPDPTAVLGGTVARRNGTTPWLLTERFHLQAIEAAVKAGDLIPVEATAIAGRSAFADAERMAEKTLRSAIKSRSFDAMLDVRAARERGVTPLPIITDGPLA